MVLQDSSQASASSVHVENKEYDLQCSGIKRMTSAESCILPSIHSLGERISSSINLHHTPVTENAVIDTGKLVSSSINLLQTPVIQTAEMNMGTERNSTALHAGNVRDYRSCFSEDRHDLSLSLDCCRPAAANTPAQRRQNDLNMKFSVSNVLTSEGLGGDHYGAHMKKIERNNLFGRRGCVHDASNSLVAKQICSPSELASSKANIKNSRFLAATQSLLDEAVSIRKDVDSGCLQCFSPTPSNLTDNQPGGLAMRIMTGQLVHEREKIMEYCLPDCSSAKRKDLCIRIEKLFSLLDQVENRYQQYCCRMEEVITLFEDAAGSHAAKSYTSLAQHTIIRHFQCLRDAILSEIHATKRRLAVDPQHYKTMASEFCPIDLHIRQGKALPHSGMSQFQQGWRPLRGLPENSVAILRAWLFEHFLHPYPNDSEKLALATQTGLTRNQVSNWFINARVRLWKPMIEEMYKEEIEQAEEDANRHAEI